MKPSEIQPGKAYEGANGAVRYITGDADSRSPRQQDRDEVQYIVARGRKLTGGPDTGRRGIRGRTATSTRRALARWAVRPATLGAEERDFIARATGQ